MIFVDTSFWVALQVARDANHDDSVALLESHGNSGMLTTNHVVGETWTFMRRRAGHGPAVAFLDAVDRSPRISVKRVTADVEARALAWLRRHDERTYSFVDATSFATMQSEKVTSALAFDGDFSAAGFVELRA